MTPFRRKICCMRGTASWWGAAGKLFRVRDIVAAMHSLLGMDRASCRRADDGCAAVGLAPGSSPQHGVGPANRLIQPSWKDKPGAPGGRVMMQAARRRVVGLALLALWFGFVCFAAWNHVVWRDEVRALSLALQGDNVFAMLRAIHGEGHPAIWYLLLRGTHAVVGRPEVLQVASLAVASAAFLLLVLRSPLDLLMIALLLASPFGIFEFSVNARNYGISMLVMFSIAACYDRYRNRGVVLGVLLFLLANCNAHSALLAMAFLLFWLVDIIDDSSVQRSRVLQTFLLNAVVAALGIAACTLTVFPTFNDAAMLDQPGGITLSLLLKAVLLPAQNFIFLMPQLSESVTNQLPRSGIPDVDIWNLLMSAIMFGSTLGLVRRRGAVLAAVAALIGFSLFFKIIYPGFYRHEALWLVFLISLYWIAGARSARRTADPAPLPTPRIQSVSAIGSTLFLLLVALQAPTTILMVAEETGFGPPLSRSRDLAALITQRPELRDAVIIADPDYMLEPLPYYIANQTYLMREQRFGNVVKFTRHARLRLDLDDILADARRLHRDTGKPIVILLKQKIDPSQPSRAYREGLNWELVTTPAQVRAFQAATRHVAGFGPALSDESFEVYVFDQS
jgi:hypothetical protein